MTPQQAREARKLMGWTLADLRERTGLAIPTLYRFEQDHHQHVAQKIEAAFRTAGFVFSPEGGVRRIVIAPPDAG